MLAGRAVTMRNRRQAPGAPALLRLADADLIDSTPSTTLPQPMRRKPSAAECTYAREVGPVYEERITRRDRGPLRPPRSVIRGTAERHAGAREGLEPTHDDTAIRQGGKVRL